MRARLFTFCIAAFALVWAVGVCAEPSFVDGQEMYYKNLKSCTPSVFTYDALMMGYKNTSKIVGKQNGKCVFQEEINPEVVMVCKLPMHINAKYADEQLKFLKSKIAVKNSYVDKINSDTRYCNLEVVK